MLTVDEDDDIDEDDNGDDFEINDDCNKKRPGVFISCDLMIFECRHQRNGKQFGTFQFASV